MKRLGSIGFALALLSSLRAFAQTPVPTNTPTPVPTVTPSITPTPTFTFTPTPTFTFSATPTSTVRPTNPPLPPTATPVSPTPTPSGEGYDPLKSISTNGSKANVLIVFDTSTNMLTAGNGASHPSSGATASSPFWNSGAETDTATAMTNAQISDSTGSTMSWTYNGSGCDGPITSNSTKCNIWTYTLHWNPPSAMALAKNALGNSVTVYSYIWPSNITSTSAWITERNWTSGGGFRTYITQAGSYAYTFSWDKSGTGSSDRNPGMPNTTIGSLTSTFSPTVLAGSTLTPVNPQNLIGNTSSQINWGLVVYPAKNITLCTDEEALVVPPDVCESDTTSTGCSTYMRPGGVSYRGQVPSVLQALFGLASPSTVPCFGDGTQTCGNGRNTADPDREILGLAAGNTNGTETSTVRALTYAKTLLTDIMKTGGTVTLRDSANVTWRAGNDAAAFPNGLWFGTSATIGGGSTFSLPADPNASKCSRQYGVLLVTSGASARCNTGDGTWSSCLTDTTIPSSGYPASVASQIYALTNNNGKALYPRTFVLGPSSSLADQNKCELNKTAYAGKTDKSSSLADFGYDVFTTSDGDDAETDTRLTGTYVSDWGYAFYADDTTKTIVTALGQFYAPGAGDYSTGSPLTLASLTSRATKDEDVILASSDYPQWRGHLRLLKPGRAESDRIQWDAGEFLSGYTTAGATISPTPAAYVAPTNRKIYTFGRIGSGGTGALTLVALPTSTGSTDMTNFKALAATYAGLTLTDEVALNLANFIRGYDGAGTADANRRGWLLGPITNSQPALIGPPGEFVNFTGTTAVCNHAFFQTDYATRTPLVWVGSDDGLVHAFALDASSSEGREVIALLPPNLIYNAYELFYQHRVNSTGSRTDNFQTGQVPSLDAHVYGVANGIRFADVCDPSGSKNDPTGDGTLATNYKTVLFLTEGPGGDLVAAIDVTHPTSGDPNYSSSAPVTPLWIRAGARGGTSEVLTGLKETWSVPAIGTGNADGAVVGQDGWRVFLASGRNRASAKSSQQAGKLFVLDALTGVEQARNSPLTLTAKGLTSTANPDKTWVGQQAFANSVAFDSSENAGGIDDIDDAIYEADLNGQIWAMRYTGGEFTDLANNVNPVIDATNLDSITNSTRSTTNKTATTPSIADQTQPLYYPPAVGGLGDTNNAGTGCTIFAFGSGSVNEASSNLTTNIGLSSPTVGFNPSLFTATRAKSAITTAVDPTHIIRTAINTLPKKDSDCSSVTTTSGAGTGCLSNSTQLTAAPILAVPKSDTGEGSAIGIFTLYDPVPTGSSTCLGSAYVALLAVKGDLVNISDPCAISSVYSTATYIGGTISSGIAIGGKSGNNLLVAQSGIGSGGKATVSQLDVTITPSPKTVSTKATWWRELK